MPVRVTGLSRFVNLTKETPQAIDRTMDSVLRQEARALCVSLGAATLPGGYGGGLAEGPIKKYEDSIRAQVHRVYATRDEKARLIPLLRRRSEKLARGYARALREGNEAQQRRYLREAGIAPETLDPAVHRRARTGRGASVPKKLDPQAVVPANQLRRYMREKGELAGLAKAGWYAAARAIGGRVRRNLVDPGGKRRTEEIFPARLRRLARRFPGLGGAVVSHHRVEVFSAVRHAGDALPDDLYDRAVMSAQVQFRRAMEQALQQMRRRGWKLAI